MGGITKENRIDCRKAQELFFELPEKALSSAEADALRAHAASCRECGCEFEEWLPLRAALRSPGLRAAPPPDFTAGVMARIAGIRPEAKAAKTGPGARLIGYFRQSLWGKGIAAAALILALLTGSVSLATRLPGLQVAGNETGSHRTVQERKNPEKTVASAGPTVTEKEPGKTNPAPPDNTTPNVGARGEETDGGSADTATPPVGNTAEGRDTGKVFLNKTRYITTTMLKVQVPDLEDARKTALHLTQSEDGRLQSEYSTQNQGRRNAILRLTVPDEQAEPFVKRLAELGTVVTREVSRQDITENFAGTLQEYRSLKAQQAEATGEEKERLKDEITFLENQLQSWDEESDKQVVILLLEEAG